ncbi:uncharacterized protein LTR77_010551 [Saxophila tyrrhenica]|uniref:Major facilitator superfamily (MFS) profile domain-containing protein n=1 Tax=Saxophila tyrrhenica TaxID=1690608 RepID=A0AAV9NVC6_9PEZI|nr:hypothetical protein LTR77_010551 [Saxophila tyrrhenica]
MAADEEKHESVDHIDLDAEKKHHALPTDYVEDPALERRITRKCDFHILPWIFALWLLAFIDRSNIGNARIDGMEEDLDLEGNDFNIALTVFYILYVLLDVPSNWLLKIVGGGRYLPMLAMAWGIVGTCMGAVKSFGGLVACRMLLGACEGGMFGGIILYLSMFYKRHNLMFRLGIFYCAAPLSGAFGGLLATGLSQIDYHGYNGWPWIFFIEGAITIVVAAVAFFFLPNTPGSASFLSEDERLIAVHRLHADLQGGTSREKVEEEKFSWAAVRFALLNVNTLLMSFNFFLILIPIYSYSLFLPSIIEGMGYSNVTAQLFTVPPNFLAFLVVIGSSYLSDRIKMRGPLIVVGFTIAAVGYIMQLASDSNAVRYAGTFFIAVGAFPCSPLILAWLSNNLAPHYTKATGVGFQVAIGNCGAFVATFTYLPGDAPDYRTGHSINLGAIGLTLIGVIANILYIRWENAARRAGKREYRFEQQREGEGELGYRHPEFRYTT